MPISGKYALPSDQSNDATLRQTVRVTAPGERIRVHISNAFGTTPLVVAKAGVARSSGPGSTNLAGDPHLLTFAGRTPVTILPGAEIVSDPVDLPVNAFDDLSISLWQASMPQPQTGHIAAHATSFSFAGDHVADAAPDSPHAFTHWYELTAIDVEAPPAEGVVAVIGDSISDGTGIADDSNRRWTDFLARQLRAAGLPMAVINLGIGGNRVMHNGNGPSALSRLDRDVLARDGVQLVIVYEGVNDLGTATRNHPLEPAAHMKLVAAVEAAYSEIIDRVHAHNIKVFGATIAPYGGSPLYHPDTANERDRQVLNDWIRTPGHFDGVIDFDAVLRDPASPDRLRVEYDSGDHLHPAPGYNAMADAGCLLILRKFGAYYSSISKHGCNDGAQITVTLSRRRF